jgi:hypothetical protein
VGRGKGRTETKRFKIASKNGNGAAVGRLTSLAQKFASPPSACPIQGFFVGALKVLQKTWPPLNRSTGVMHHKKKGGHCRSGTLAPSSLPPRCPHEAMGRGDCFTTFLSLFNTSQKLKKCLWENGGGGRKENALLLLVQNCGEGGRKKIEARRLLLVGFALLLLVATRPARAIKKRCKRLHGKQTTSTLPNQLPKPNLHLRQLYYLVNLLAKLIRGKQE